MVEAGEQDLPIAGGKDVSQDAIASINYWLERQNAKGRAKYGMGITTFNGRDSVREIWEEHSDETNYLQALCAEYEWMLDMLHMVYYEVADAQIFIASHSSETQRKFIECGNHYDK